MVSFCFWENFRCLEQNPFCSFRITIMEFLYKIPVFISAIAHRCLASSADWTLCYSDRLNWAWTLPRNLFVWGNLFGEKYPEGKFFLIVNAKLMGSFCCRLFPSGMSLFDWEILSWIFPLFAGGTYRCSSANAGGEASADIRLQVLTQLHLEISPPLMSVHMGGSAEFR